MKKIGYLVALILSLLHSVAPAANASTDLSAVAAVPQILMSSDLKTYLASSEGANLFLTGIEWNSEGQNDVGRFEAFQILFLRIDETRTIHHCKHLALAYFSQDKDGLRTLEKVGFDRTDLNCDVPKK